MMEFFRGRLFKSVVMVGMAVIFAVGFGMVYTGVSRGSFGGGQPWVLKVNGQKIDVHAYQQALQRQSERAQQMRLYGQDLDIAREAQNALIQKELLVEEAKRLGIVPENPGDVGRAVKQDSSLAEAFRPYGRALGAAEAVRAFAEDQAIQGIIQSVQNVAVISDAEIEADFLERNTKAKVRFVEIPLSHYQERVSVSDAEAKTYYDKHAEAFWRGASIQLEVLKVDPLFARATTTVSDDEVKKYYEEHRADYEEEQVNARHILRKFPPNPTPQQEEEVRKKAEEILKKAKAPGADFAALAKEFSEDPGSAANGGSLGWFGRGQMVAPFENAVFALEKGQISDLVKTVYGFHIVKLEEKRQSVKPFEQVAPEIRNELVLKRAAEKTREDAEELFFDVEAMGPEKAIQQERFRSYHLTLQKTGFFSRGDSTLPNLGSAWQYRELIEKAFAARVGPWLEPIEVKPSYNNEVLGYFITRVVERKPAGVADFASVKEEIIKNLKEQKAAALAETAAKNLWKRFTPGDTLDVLVKKYTPGPDDPKELSIRESGEFTTNTSGYVSGMGSCKSAMVAAFQMNPKEVRGPFKGQMGYYIIELIERKDPDRNQLTEAERANIRQRLLSTKQATLFNVWYQDIRDRAKVTRNEKILAQF